MNVISSYVLRVVETKEDTNVSTRILLRNVQTEEEVNLLALEDVQPYIENELSKNRIQES